MTQQDWYGHPAGAESDRDRDRDRDRSSHATQGAPPHQQQQQQQYQSMGFHNHHLSGKHGFRSSPPVMRPPSSASMASVGSFTVASAASGSVGPSMVVMQKQQQQSMASSAAAAAAIATGTNHSNSNCNNNSNSNRSTPVNPHDNGSIQQQQQQQQQQPPYHQQQAYSVGMSRFALPPMHQQGIVPVGDEHMASNNPNGRRESYHSQATPIHHPMPYRHQLPPNRPYHGHQGYTNQFHAQHPQQYPPFQDMGYLHDHQFRPYASTMAAHLSHQQSQYHPPHFQSSQTSYLSYFTENQRQMMGTPKVGATNSSRVSGSLSPPPPPLPPPTQSNTKRSERKSTPSSQNPTWGEAKERTRPESANSVVKSDAGKEDDDAASILLQLSGVPSQSSEKDDEDDDEEHTYAMQERPLSTINTHPIPASSFPRQNTNNHLLKPISSMTSNLDDDATIATQEAPELTSEPSNDTIEKVAIVSDFPCPVPKEYPNRLALENDEQKLNSLHCFLREELLEIFVVEKSKIKSRTHSPGSSVGRVGLRCVHCAMSRTDGKENNRNEAPMAVFYPKTIGEIYRLVTSWQRCHLRKCRNLPPAIREKWRILRETDRSRGKTEYWVTSAKQIGLVDCPCRGGGIRFLVDDETHEIQKSNSISNSIPNQTFNQACTKS